MKTPMPLLRRVTPLLATLLPVLASACGGGDAMADPAPAPAVPATDAAAPDRRAPRAGWVHGYTGDLQIDGIASDASSDVYAAGYFVGRAEFDPTHALDSVPDDKGAPTKDIFVSKHARGTGALAWVRHFGGAGHEGNVYDLVAGPDGTVVASGAFSGTVDFDGTILTATVGAGSGSASSGTYGNMFIAGLDAAGKVRWVHQATGDLVSGGNEVATDPSGGFVQVGIFGGRIEPGGTATVGGYDLAFEGGRFDSYISKLSAAGEVAWVKPIGGSGAQRGKAIAADAQGNVLVAGDAWDGETRFSPTAAFTSKEQDFWVAKYSPAGDLLWFHSYGSEGIDEVKGIGADSTGNVIVAASFASSSIDVGGRTVTARPDAKNTGLVFALSPDGARVLWTNTISAVSKCCELEVDARGHTLLGLAALGPSVAYGSGGGAAVGGAPRGPLLTELGADGAHVASWTGQAEAGELGELTLLADGSLAVAGSFDGAAFQLDDLQLAGSALRTQFVLVLDR